MTTCILYQGIDRTYSSSGDLHLNVLGLVLTLCHGRRKRNWSIETTLPVDLVIRVCQKSATVVCLNFDQAKPKLDGF